MDNSSRFSKNSLWLFVLSSFSCCSFSSCFWEASSFAAKLSISAWTFLIVFLFSAVSWLPFSRESRISSFSFERTPISSFRRFRFSFMKLSFCWDADASRRIFSRVSRVCASSFYQSSSSFCRVSMKVSSSSSSCLEVSSSWVIWALSACISLVWRRISSSSRWILT